MPKHNFDPLQGRLELISVHAPGLEHNRLGDPASRQVGVYLPKGYDDSDATYPLFVDLAGFTGSGLRRLAWVPFGESMPQRIDRLVATKRMGPVVCAFPDGFTSLGGNQYIDSPVFGAWGRFLAEDLPRALEARYRVRRDPASRAVFGRSSGGYGAIVQGMLHADAWGAVACHSGDMAFEWVYAIDFPKCLDLLARHEGGVSGFLTHVQTCKKLSGLEFHVLMMLAMAATYDPPVDPHAPIRLPVDPETCEFDPAAWARWLAHDPLRMIERPDCQANLRSLRGLFIDCGRRDQYFMHYGSRAFARKLTQATIPHTYEEFDDDHSGIDYRLDVSLPFLFNAIHAPGPAVSG